MHRRSLLLAFAQVVRPLDERGALTEWFGALAAHLTEDSPAEFLSRFDRAMPGKPALETNVYALLKVYAVASIADIREITGEGEERDVNLDWILSLRPKPDGATGERRRRMLQFHLRRRKKGWIVTSLSDPSFFAP